MGWIRFIDLKTVKVLVHGNKIQKSLKIS